MVSALLMSAPPPLRRSVERTAKGTVGRARRLAWGASQDFALVALLVSRILVILLPNPPAHCKDLALASLALLLAPLLAFPVSVPFLAGATLPLVILPPSKSVWTVANRPVRLLRAKLPVVLAKVAFAQVLMVPVLPILARRSRKTNVSWRDKDLALLAHPTAALACLAFVLNPTVLV